MEAAEPACGYHLGFATFFLCVYIECFNILASSEMCAGIYAYLTLLLPARKHLIGANQGKAGLFDLGFGRE